MSPLQLIRITGALAGVACFLCLVGAWNGIYNLMTLAESAESMGGEGFVADKAHRALLYLSGAGVSFIWFCVTVYFSLRPVTSQQGANTEGSC